MIQFHPWRWLRIGRVLLYYHGPADAPLFSERNGQTKPFFSWQKHRLFYEWDKLTPKDLAKRCR